MKEWVSQVESFSKIRLRGKKHMSVVYLGGDFQKYLQNR